MNRITRLLHKARFLSRHRRILAYSHKYVITAADLDRYDDNTVAQEVATAKKCETETAKIVDHLLGYFDTEKNETDRRIFYEVTGR